MCAGTIDDIRTCSATSVCNLSVRWTTADNSYCRCICVEASLTGSYSGMRKYRMQQTIATIEAGDARADRRGC